MYALLLEHKSTQAQGHRQRKHSRPWDDVGLPINHSRTCLCLWDQKPTVRRCFCCGDLHELGRPRLRQDSPLATCDDLFSEFSGRRFDARLTTNRLALSRGITLNFFLTPPPKDAIFRVAVCPVEVSAKKNERGSRMREYPRVAYCPPGIKDSFRISRTRSAEDLLFRRHHPLRDVPSCRGTWMVIIFLAAVLEICSVEGISFFRRAQLAQPLWCCSHVRH